MKDCNGVALVDGCLAIIVNVTNFPILIGKQIEVLCASEYYPGCAGIYIPGVPTKRRKYWSIEPANLMRITPGSDLIGVKKSKGATV